MDIAIQYPWFRRSAYSSYYTPRIYDQHFGEPISGTELYAPMASSYYPRMHPQNLPGWVENGHSEMRLDKDRYTINLDVKHFSPEGLTVKINGEFIEVHGKHEERKDNHGSVSREFIRKYQLPAGVNPGTVTSSLSAEGVLTIIAPFQHMNAPERTIPIDNKPALSAAQKK